MVNTINENYIPIFCNKLYRVGRDCNRWWLTSPSNWCWSINSLPIKNSFCFFDWDLVKISAGWSLEETWGRETCPHQFFPKQSDNQSWYAWFVHEKKIGFFIYQTFIVKYMNVGGEKWMLKSANKWCNQTTSLHVVDMAWYPASVNHFDIVFFLISV